jgi:hypothetical protein
LADWLSTHAVPDIEQRYTLYVTFAVVSGAQESMTLATPLPERVGPTLLMLLANVTVPAAAPGEPVAGAKVAVTCTL